MNTTTRSALLSLSIVIVGAALTGCTVSVSSPPATDPAPAIGSTPHTGSVSSPSVVPSDAATGSTPLLDDERMARLHRTTWADSVTQHLTCADGALTVDRNSDALVVEVAGECRDVMIAAVGATVLLPAVGRVSIDDDGSIVIVESADEIVLSADADANLVGWERGTPVVRDAGVMNATTPIS